MPRRSHQVAQGPFHLWKNTHILQMLDPIALNARRD
jgi:hypothetical protein